MNELSDMTIIPINSNSSAIKTENIQKYLGQVPEWNLIEVNGEPRLERSFKLNNFQDALQFANQVGELAETANHHPSILIEWGKATISWWTHKIRGLHLNDFIMAAKTDQVYAEQSKNKGK